MKVPQVNVLTAIVVGLVIVADVVLTVMGKPVPAPITGGVALVCAMLPAMLGGKTPPPGVP